ncbi:TIGR04219 family outer membrane beta-barrel protein [Aliarcobacter sp.]|uniref:TIGR04219 family outer membrane beta-barrel protein n=1 Tax=Aliarcobacter sp. TaxID=2321116 RepID=UPI00356AE276
MKKVLKVAAISSTLLLSVANADFLRAEVGAGAWFSKSSGNIKADSSGLFGIDSSKEKTKTNMYAWALFKHFVPVVPNLKVEYSKVESIGLANGNFSGYSGGGNESKLTMKQLDIIPYYNILDNTFWTTIDLGVDIKIIDAQYSVSNKPASNVTKTIPLPMGYARARVEVPFSGIGIEADAKYIKYSDNLAYDAKAKIDYTFDITPLIKPAIEIGYRVQKVEVDRLADLKTDLDFKGIYAGLMLRF